MDSGSLVLIGRGLDLHHVQLATPWPGHSAAGAGVGCTGCSRGWIRIGAQRPERRSHTYSGRILNAGVHASVWSSGVGARQPCRGIVRLAGARTGVVDHRDHEVAIPIEIHILQAVTGGLDRSVAPNVPGIVLDVVPPIRMVVGGTRRAGKVATPHLGPL